MRWLISGAHIIDPANDYQGVSALYLADGRIVGGGAFDPPPHFTPDAVLDARGLYLMPGIVDIGPRLREPGDGIHGDMETELRAAVAGGITAVISSPHTEPVADATSIIKGQIARAKEIALARVYPMGALTMGLGGERLSEMASLRTAGAVAMSDGGQPFADTQVFRHALDYAASLELPVVLSAKDPFLGLKGQMHEGEVSARLGIPGSPAAAEALGMARASILGALTGAPIHIRAISSRIALAQLDASSMSVGVYIHHLHLSHVDVGYFDARAKLWPPLRELRDRDALRQALADKKIQVISSGHSPWHEDAKSETFQDAKYGIASFELLLPLSLRLVEDDKLSLMDMARCLSTAPARVFGMDFGSLRPGAHADLCLFDPQAEYCIKNALMRSMGSVTPYEGWTVRGRIVHTFVGGRLVYSWRAIP